METPWNMRELGDSAFCDGLTRMVFHSYISNQSSDIAIAVKADTTFRIANKVPELWDAVTGKIRTLSEYK